MRSSGATEMAVVQRLPFRPREYMFRFPIRRELFNRDRALFFDLNRRLRALIAGVAAGLVQLGGNWIDLDVRLVVGAEFKDLRGDVRADAAADAKVQVDVCLHV